jgi:hypothetical protein
MAKAQTVALMVDGILGLLDTLALVAVAVAAVDMADMANYRGLMATAVAATTAVAVAAPAPVQVRTTPTPINSVVARLAFALFGGRGVRSLLLKQQT